MKYLMLLVVLASLLPWAASAGQDADDLKPYPVAQEGSMRAVFRVPALENEADRKVEILVGKTLLVDCNRTWFGGDLEQRVVQGWGYPYFVLENVAPPRFDHDGLSPRSGEIRGLRAGAGRGLSPAVQQQASDRDLRARRIRSALSDLGARRGIQTGRPGVGAARSL